MKQQLEFLLLIGVATLLAGCKLATIVVEGGEVRSTGSGTCMAGTVCMIEVTDTNFSESFTAVPEPGRYFKEWKSGDRFICGGSARPECTLDLQEYEGNDGVEKIVASNDVAYLMPVFRQVQSIMIRVEGRSVIVDDKEWLQPVDFLSYSCPEIGMLCPPDQVCSGSLPGSTIDLTGYRWASSDDVYALFNVYDGLNRSVFEDFDPTLADRDKFGHDVANIMYAMLGDVVYRGCDPETIATVYDGTPEETGMEERNIGIFPVPEPLGGKDFRAGAWFWRSIDQDVN